MDFGRLLRAGRRVRAISQRELADIAGVPPSTVDRIEAGRVRPQLETFIRLLAALNYRLVVADAAGRVLAVDDDHDRVRDAAGRRFPAHLYWSRTPEWHDHEGPSWWGWLRISWPYGYGATPPEYTYWRRQSVWPGYTRIGPGGENDLTKG